MYLNYLVIYKLSKNKINLDNFKFIFNLIKKI